MFNKLHHAISVTLILIFISVYTLVPISGNAEKKKGLYQDLFSVSFPSKNEGWACGRWGTILHSSDGGETWAPQQSGTDYTLSSTSFVDSKTVGQLGMGERSFIRKTVEKAG